MELTNNELQYCNYLNAKRIKFVVTHTGIWEEKNKYFMSFFPFDKKIRPSNKEILSVFLRTFKIGIRYATEIVNYGYNSYTIICDYKPYSFDVIHSKARNQIRKGEKFCIVKKIDKSLLKEQGFDITISTVIRQQRKKKIDIHKERVRFNNDIDSFTDIFEYWGAFIDNKLVAYIITLDIDNTTQILVERSLSEFLKYNPNNYLVYYVTKEKLSNKNIKYISFGLETVGGKESLDHFKLRMGYKKETIKQRIIFNPFLFLFLNKITVFLLLPVIKIFIKNRHITGLLSMYLKQSYKFTEEGEDL